MIDMKAVVSRQRAAVMAELPVSVRARKDRLKRAIALLTDNAGPLCDALSIDFGHRSREQSMLTDIGGSITPLKHALDNVERWMRPDSRKVQFPLGLLGAKAWVEYQPKGVVGIITPWNFPINLLMAPLAGVFAAGNRAIAKTSEYTPATTELLQRLVSEAFDGDEFTLVSGGPEVGQAFAELPLDHLIFTGATSIGRHILRAAADNLTPVTLELGGKSPVIIGKGADLAKAAERITLGKMMNAGQICLAPDYVLVPDQQEDAFAGEVKSAAERLYPTLLRNPDYTALINARHHQRLTDWLDNARGDGALVETINPAGENFDGTNVMKMPLSIVRNVSDDMTLMQQEIFGPVLPIAGYRGIEDAIAQINHRDRPLGLYYFGPDDAERRLVLDRTISGGVTLDDVIFHVSMEDLPFGGIGPSGMGAYHGFDGFKTFSHAKSVYRQAKVDVAKIAGFKPPYGAATRRGIRRAVGKVPG